MYHSTNKSQIIFDLYNSCIFSGHLKHTITVPVRTAAYDTRNKQVTPIRVEREGIVLTPLLEVGFQHSGLILYTKGHPSDRGTRRCIVKISAG